MGFSIQNVVILYWLKHHGMIKASDAVLELGSQQINNDVIEHLIAVDGLAKLFGVAPFSKTFNWKILDPQFLQSGMQHLPEDAPFAKVLYEHLGLRYGCVDINEHRDSIRLDLNFDSVPTAQAGKYALVTNLGTTEHVANQLNAFKVIHDFTAPNGVMIHSLPFQGFATHGLINYTMKFFWLLVQSNQYRVLDADVSSWEKSYMPAEIIDYTKKHSLIFENKQHVDKVKFQDTGMTLVLQKCFDAPFVPPLDASVNFKEVSPLLVERYGKAICKEPFVNLPSRIKTFIKKLFNF